MGVLGLRLDRSRKTVWDMLCVGDRFPRAPAFYWNDLMREENTKKKTSQSSTSKTSGVRVVLILRVPQKGRVPRVGEDSVASLGDKEDLHGVCMLDAEEHGKGWTLEGRTDPQDTRECGEGSGCLSQDGPGREDRLGHPAGRGLVTCSPDFKEEGSGEGGPNIEGRSKEPVEYEACVSEN